MKKIIALLLIIGAVLGNQSCTNSNASSVAPLTVTKSENKITKKEAIGKMIDALETDMVSYDWMQGSSCNIGVLAQCVTNATEKEIYDRRSSEYNDFFIHLGAFNKDSPNASTSWVNIINYYCGVTGRPVKGIVSDLNKAGFSNYDIKQFEYLDNSKLLKEAGIDTKQKMYWAQKENVLKYLKAWLSHI